MDLEELGRFVSQHENFLTQHPHVAEVRGESAEKLPETPVPTAPDEPTVPDQAPVGRHWGPRRFTPIETPQPGLVPPTSQDLKLVQDKASTMCSDMEDRL